jgi:anaerobic sulfite reductase subunit C
MQWDKDAEELIARAPFLVRGLVRRKIEDIARSRGARRVSAEIARQAYAEFRGVVKGDIETPPREFIERLEEKTKLVARDELFCNRHYRVRPCAGAVGCPRALIPVLETAEALAHRIAQSGFPDFLDRGMKGRPILSHNRLQAAVAGCANACSQPQIQDFGVIGAATTTIRRDRCDQCEHCVQACHEGAISLREGAPVIDTSLCIQCGDCARACPTGALALGEACYVVVAGGKLGRHPRLAARVGEQSELRAVLETLDRALAALMTNGKAGGRLAGIMDKAATGVFREKTEATEHRSKEVVDG